MSWSATNFFDVVPRRKSYVAGKRKPSSERRLPSPANFPGSVDVAVAARYAFAERRGWTCRSRKAIAFTFGIRSAISRRVKPSGKTIRNGFGGGGATAVVTGAGESRSLPIANPGLASIQAAAHPARVSYLYFVRKPDKVHHFFTASFAAFQAYASSHGF